MSDQAPQTAEQGLLADVLVDDERYVIAQLTEDDMTPERLAGRLLARALHDTSEE
ncbi:MAG: hypothetical protein Q7T55_04480 [Solirubrobacteraceae bacterium]|nr:hypothetical protein [Solirubrobacteraceae bacterium]